MKSELKNAKQVVVEGSQINYFDIGQGEVVLLLHGITTYSFIWRNVVADLAQKYRVIIPDLLGCGDSDKPLNVSYSLKNHARFMAEMMDRLKIKRYHLVGHDLGGGISQIMTVNNPETIIDLTLINTVAYNFWPVQPIIAMRTPIIRQIAMATLDWGTFKIIVQRGLYFKDRCTNELMEYFFKPVKTPEGRKAFLHFASSLDNKNLMEISDKLHSLQMPLLIIRGDGDVYLESKIAETLNENISNSKLVRIEKAGHFIQEDAPELLVEHLFTFFVKDKV